MYTFPGIPILIKLTVLDNLSIELILLLSILRPISNKAFPFPVGLIPLVLHFLSTSSYMERLQQKKQEIERGLVLNSRGCLGSYQYKDVAKGYKVSGAGGGGYFIIVSDKNIDDAIRIKARRVDIK